MTKTNVYPVNDAFASKAYINKTKYMSMYKESIKRPEKFWADQADQFVSWYDKWDTVLEWDYLKADISWFKGATLNVSYNCLDRHLKSRGNQIAIIWEGDDPTQDKSITYNELHAEVCKFANALKSRGVKKGDCICIYMPMIPEAAVVMLACTRIGAIHSVVFGGFSPDSLRDRILDSNCKTVITADEGIRGGKAIPLKNNTDIALQQCPEVKNVIVVERTKGNIQWNENRDYWYHDIIATESADCQAEHMSAEDPLFILYTSGSTGKPKGVLHTAGGYLLYAAITHKYVFDYHENEVYWCTADVGWVTGHTYIIYGPLCNGAKTLMFEGVPNYPDGSRFWQVVDKHQVASFYTAPTAIRSLMALGNEPVEKTQRTSLRVLGTVGEPINPEAWEWYYHVVGQSRCPIVDTWWQTETGGHLITPLPGATTLKPGSASLPFFGIQPVILDDEGNELEGECQGNLAFKFPWPGQMRTIYGDHNRFIETYFSQFPGYYFSGDGCRRDEDGYYWITGRVDDVLNISGHRIGTAEIESALVLHETVAEAAVVGCAHDIKGQAIYCYVTTMVGVKPTEELKEELIQLVRKEIGAFAKPDFIQWASGLPKTRSGKIMRRILRKIAASEVDDLGDTSTLADPGIVADIIKNRLNK
tara:strand:+ start:78217 stop:80154 length:1938 start_codon:yes stop_codon:yes gene_type:complete